MTEQKKDIDRMVAFALSAQQEMEKLEHLTGLSEFKKTMKAIMSAQKQQIIACSRGRTAHDPSFHMCFLGNPGTGKTKMARYAADILYRAGLVSTDKFIVAGRSDLVGDHVGETAIKTKRLLARASGGVLFIDEAYSLMDDRDESFGDEAINTLVDEMDNRRGNLVIILAGYPNRMNQLLTKNPGLQSRVPFTVHFDDYTEDQLYDIAEEFAAQDGYYFREDVRDKLTVIFRNAMKDCEFGNARYVRNLVERAEAAKADQIDLMEIMSLSDDQLFQLTPSEFSSIALVKDYAEERRIGF